jgi:hypothetical protein
VDSLDDIVIAVAHFGAELVEPLIGVEAELIDALRQFGTEVGDVAFGRVRVSIVQESLLLNYTFN